MTVQVPEIPPIPPIPPIPEIQVLPPWMVMPPQVMALITIAMVAGAALVLLSDRPGASRAGSRAGA